MRGSDFVRILHTRSRVLKMATVAASFVCGLAPALATDIAKAVVVGGFHSCALTDAGRAKCWGDNGYGQLGDGTTKNRLHPVDVSGLTSGVAALTAGDWHTCALSNAGGVKCWGWNYDGQLGDGTRTDSNQPVDVIGLGSGVSAIAAGATHTCALTLGGGVKCWGNNISSQLGDGTTTERHTPVDVTRLGGRIAAVAAGGYHTCALSDAGGVKCWGDNGYGQLGDGTTKNRLHPVDVSGLTSGVIAIAAGDVHSCALTEGGAVKCWGFNLQHQLGDGTLRTERHTPVDVKGLGSGVTAIAVRVWNGCAITSTGGAKCWGDNFYGQLGDGTKNVRRAPVDVKGLNGVTAIAPGGGTDFLQGGHTCAIAGAIKCWGTNLDGQIGDGTTVERLTPTKVKRF